MEHLKPTIIIFTTAYHPYVGGAEVAIQEITGRLKGLFDFYIVTARMRRDLPMREVRPEGTVFRVGFGTNFDKWLLPVFGCFRLSLEQLSKTKSRAIILGVDISQGSLAAALFKLFHPKNPFIFNIQYGYGDERLKSGRLGAIDLALRFILGRADYVTAISTYLFDLARKYGYKGPVEIVHNGVDFNKFKNPVPGGRGLSNEAGRQNSKIIITTSRLVSKNGVDILIKAFAEVRKNISDVLLYILGDGSDRKRLENEVKSLKLEDRVIFFGNIPYKEIPKYLHQADFFVRPSRSEGMGNSFVEALAAGLPIIGTPVGGITDIIEDGKTGLLARVDDHKDLAKKIIYLCNNSDLAQSIVAEGQKMVRERFSWGGVSRAYERIFSNSVKNQPFNILMATPLLPPQLGGPALYAKNLGEEFKKMGHSVNTVVFGTFLRYPSGVRHLFYLFSLLWYGLKSDVIFALDYTSVGFPAAVASFFLHRPFVIRVEGDFLWESFVERTRLDYTLKKFYESTGNLPLSYKERLILFLTKYVFRRADFLVFSSQWRRNMILEYFNISLSKTAIIQNVWPRGIIEAGRRKKIILWAGRMLYLKNLYRLIRAFEKAKTDNYELHLVGEGPELVKLKGFLRKEGYRHVRFYPKMSHGDFLEKISLSAFFVLPSLSDVGPNVISDAIFTKTPFIMTRESGYMEYVGRSGLFVDPLSEEDIFEKIKILMDLAKYNTYQQALSGFPLNRGWDIVSKEWGKLLDLLRNNFRSEVSRF